ncbi:MAG: hypothetical protein ACXABY_11465 [Candidatus Thorarchaeota archaeon]|jgi:hypothetical protein
MINHCRACRTEAETWFHGQGLLCTECRGEYQALEDTWRAQHNRNIDYIPFHLWANFLRKKKDEQDKDSTQVAE